eukprot:CAMPEP_0195530394 /NCGR_PEP_ID=MMETSP0794_2-20130614/33263_1 /TAXON_ID=515487 /ORGANISM="Stephanopyxis turris, Strain CCMP 815" /LENGTH=71 /DNA_ID=CAMNT_0040661891 /DNA_START=229 /DNA_END=444 /DNA_ORIENTATION=-
MRRLRRDQLEYAIMVAMSASSAMGVAALAFSRLTPGPDGKPRRKINLKEDVLLNPWTMNQKEDSTDSKGKK